MKKFITTFFALTLFSTVGVLGGNFDKATKYPLGNFLTINGVPLNDIDWGIKEEIEKPNNSNTPQKPNTPNYETTTEATTENIHNENINSSVSKIELEVVNLVNKERAKVGLKPLKIDEEVSKVAKLKSEDMKNKNYFNHTSPTYGTPFDMLKKFNIKYKRAGENIAKGQKTAKDVVEAWMNSEGHRRNILSNSFTHIGVGYAKKGNTPYWTQMFISK